MLIKKKKRREKMRGGRERDIVPLAPFRLISLGRKQWGVRDGGGWRRQVKSILRIESPSHQDLVAPFPLTGEMEADSNSSRKTCCL